MYQAKRVSVRYSWKTCFLSNFVKFAKFWHQNRHNQSARQYLRFFFLFFFHSAQKWIWNLTLTKLEFISLEKKWWLWTSKLWILWKTWKQSQRVAPNNRAKILVFHFVFLIVLLYSKLIRLITYFIRKFVFFFLQLYSYLSGILWITICILRTTNNFF